MKRVLSLLLAFGLTLTTIPTQAALPSQGPAQQNIQPPFALGFITDRHTASPDRKVILIQDLHAHLDTQRKIAALLKFYDSHGVLKNPVAIEGAAGAWDLSLLENYPDSARRSELFDYLLEQAGLTGPEWFALKTHRPALLFGVDDAADYEAQRELFIKTRPAREIVSHQIGHVQESLDRLSENTFKGKLRVWKRIGRRFEQGQLDADTYLQRLNSLDAGIRLSVSDPTYSDLRRHSQAVGSALARSPAEANLVKALYAADLIRRLLKQQLTLEEIRQFASRQEQFAGIMRNLLQGSGQKSWISDDDFLELVRAATDFYVAALVRDTALAANTVKLLQAPDSRLQGTTLPAASSLPTGQPGLEPRAVVLVAGGFHTAGITRELRKHGISYDVVTPNITVDFTRDDEIRYADRLCRVPVDLSKLKRRWDPLQAVPAALLGPQRHSLKALLAVPEKMVVPPREQIISMFGPLAVAWFEKYHSLEGGKPRQGYARSFKSLGLQTVPSEASEAPLMVAIREAQKRYPQGQNLAPRVREVYHVHGDLDPLHLAGYTLDFENFEGLTQQMVLRARDGQSDERGYIVYVHEDVAAPFRDYLQGGKLATPESQALFGYALLFHESFEGSADRQVLDAVGGPDYNPEEGVSHLDLEKYGATFGRVYDSLENGTPNAFLDRAREELGIDWHTIRPSNQIRALLYNFETQNEEAYQQAIESGKQVVGAMRGPGLNAVDKHLMTAYYRSSSAKEKGRLLAFRETLFERGRKLVERSHAAKISSGGTVAEVVMRLRGHIERWHQRALDYAVAYRRDYSNADRENRQLIGKAVVDEIEADVYQPLLRAVTELQALVERREIRPDAVNFKLSRTGSPANIAITDRPARVGFLPMKGDPWQIGHIFIMLQAIVENRLDKLVIMVDNSDPDRKPNLSSLTIREPITLELLKILEPFVEYSPIAREEEDLRTADGERSLFRLMQFSRGASVMWFYMVGSDHRHWEIKKDGTVVPDTAKKLRGHRESGLDGYSGEEMGIIFMERKGHEFEPGEMESLRLKSGIEAISKIYQPMDTSSTRVRDGKHWWTVPDDVFQMAKEIRFWGAENASQTRQRAPRSTGGTSRQSRRAVAIAMGLVGVAAALVLPPVWLLWSAPQISKLASVRAPADARIAGNVITAYTVDQRVHEVSHTLIRRVDSEWLNETLVEIVIYPFVFWGLVLAAFAGIVQGLAESGAPGKRVLSAIEKERMRLMAKFLASKQVTLPDLAAMAPARYRRALPEASQVFGLLFSVKDRSRRIAYTEARARLAASA